MALCKDTNSCVATAKRREIAHFIKRHEMLNSALYVKQRPLWRYAKTPTRALRQQKDAKSRIS